jgi:PDZ domain-containing protein
MLYKLLPAAMILHFEAAHATPVAARSRDWRPIASIRWPEGTEVLPLRNLEGMLLVTARLQGPAGDTTGALVLDTGAGYLALDHELAFRIGIADSLTSRLEVGVAARALTRLGLGRLDRDQVSPVLTVDAGIVRRVLDQPVLGLLGHEPLRDRALWIDYRAERAALIPSAALAAGDSDPISASRAALGEALSDAAAALRVELAGDGKVLLRARLSDPRPPRFTPWLTWILDTGSSKCVLFEESLARTRSGGTGWAMLEGLVAPTLIGAARTRLARVPAIELASAERADERGESTAGDPAPYRARDVDVAILSSDLRRVLSQVVGRRVDGLLGYSFLEGSRMVMDYPRGVLWLDPAPLGADDRPFEHSHVGIQLERRDGVARVVAVARGSPAARAGLRVGDRVVRVDGANADTLDVITLARRLEGPPGSGVTLVIRRGAAEHIHRLRRRRLL